MSAESTRFIHVIYIASTPQKVFEAITRPEIARTYWGHENVSDWKPGSRWQHVRANDERKVELVGDRTIAITYNKDRMNAGEVLSVIQGLGLGIIDVTTKEADLEDVFLRLTSTA